MEFVAVICGAQVRLGHSFSARMEFGAAQMPSETTHAEQCGALSADPAHSNADLVLANDRIDPEIFAR
jgi:hypothetical protein